MVTLRVIRRIERTLVRHDRHLNALMAVREERVRAYQPFTEDDLAIEITVNRRRSRELDLADNGRVVGGVLYAAWDDPDVLVAAYTVGRMRR